MKDKNKIAKFVLFSLTMIVVTIVLCLFHLVADLLLSQDGFHTMVIVTLSAIISYLIIKDII